MVLVNVGFRQQRTVRNLSPSDLLSTTARRLLMAQISSGRSLDRLAGETAEVKS